MEKNLTKEIIAEMLVEPVPHSFLDSGYAYGYNHERNLFREFEKEPEVKLEVWEDEFIARVPLYHFLTANLEYDRLADELTADLWRFAEEDNWSREPWHIVIEEWAAARGHGLLRGGNTYNFDCVLDQDFTWYELFPDEPDALDAFEAEYLIIRVHGGCDIRGGYTAPRIFRVYDLYEFFAGMVDLGAICQCSQFFSDDAGWHWYPNATTEDKKPSWRLDPDNQKVFCRKCNGEVTFGAYLSY